VIQFDFVAVLLVLAAGFSYLNHRFLRLPTTIGLMVVALAASLGVVVANAFMPGVQEHAAAFVHQVDFNQTVLNGMLGFLLFAGALHIELGDIGRHKWTIALLATLGVLISTLIIGALIYLVFALLGLPVRPIYCMIFGALISPTDPIAVLALLKYLGAPKSLEVTIAGESLFNDGVGVVFFLGLMEAAGTGGREFDLQGFGLLFWREAVGGAVFGLALGYLVYRLIKSVDDYQVEILLSLALVAGGYALANVLGLSGPIAMVVAGLLIGNQGRLFAMSPTTVERLDVFWELIDVVLNAVLFVLLGLEALAFTYTARNLAAGLLAIPVVVLARYISVGLPLRLLNRGKSVDRFTALILTWGGLRGALSVAMALSLPREIAGKAVPERYPILVATYIVVVFSILVQGLTMRPLARRWLGESAKQPAREVQVDQDGNDVGASESHGAGGDTRLEVK
jgi:CPA1 family monovalent cation:H+ antiporter